MAGGLYAVVRGTPWAWRLNAVEVGGQCRGALPNRQTVHISLQGLREAIGREVNEKKPVAEMKSRRGAHCWVSEDSARVIVDL